MTVKRKSDLLPRKSDLLCINFEAQFGSRSSRKTMYFDLDLSVYVITYHLFMTIFAKKCQMEFHFDPSPFGSFGSSSELTIQELP